MNWEGPALVLSGRKFGESGLILEVFAREQGRRKGLIYGGAGRRKRGLFEAGNTVSVQWQARTENQLGYVAIAEPTATRGARVMNDASALSAISSATALLSAILPEAGSYPALYDATEILFDRLEEPEIWPAVLVRWEVGLLTALGYGMNLNHCVLTGRNDGLTHVSPRSGQAVRADAAEDYVDRLLPLPSFLLDPAALAGPREIAQGFALTGHFLAHRLFADLQGEIPPARQLLIERLERAGRISLV